MVLCTIGRNAVFRRTGMSEQIIMRRKSLRAAAEPAPTPEPAQAPAPEPGPEPGPGPGGPQDFDLDRVWAHLKMIVKYRLALSSYHRQSMNDPKKSAAEKKKIEDMILQKMQETAGVGAMLYQILMKEAPKSGGGPAPAEEEEEAPAPEAA